MRLRAITLGILLAAILFVAGCNRAPAAGYQPQRPLGTPLQIAAPLGLPAVPENPENPPTAATVALGRALFFDTRLSGDESLSCASCHVPQAGFADPRPVSIGFHGQRGKRNAPTVLNAVYSPLQFWDGRARSLEEQAAGPIANPIEMNRPHEAAVTHLNKDSQLVAEFQRAFGPGPITISKVQQALAAFERTQLSGNSPFDRYQYGGERTALSPAAIRGLALFRDLDKGACSACHRIEDRYALFTDGSFHNLGVGLNNKGELTDLGRYEQTKQEADKGAFKTPTLRNIAQTAPYMHDGSLKTLREVVDFYAGGGNSNPHLDRLIRPLVLTRAERNDLVAFLESLTGEAPPVQQ